MKWIALAIAVFIAGYTVITLQFRKPGPAHRPYQDARDRATVERLRSAGFQRVSVSAGRPADPARTAAGLRNNPATIKDALGGLPRELTETLLDQPHLPQDFSAVTASSTGNALMPYALQFTCTLPDKKGVLAETFVYIKEQQVVIVPHFEKLGGELLARSRESTVLLTLPAGTLQAGRYHVVLAGRRGSKQWTVQVH
jgi:hypothetical protein